MRINHRRNCFSQEEDFVMKIGILAGSKLEVIYFSTLESIRPKLKYLKGHQVYNINSNVAYFKTKIFCIS